MLHDLGWRDLQDRRRDLRLALIYKITQGQLAVPADDLDLRKPSRNLRARHSFKYQTLSAKTTELKKFVVNKSIQDWNDLPASIAEAETFASFKSQLARLEGASA